jgi:hypothetical protein
VRGLRASDSANGVVVFSVTGEPEFGEFDATGGAGEVREAPKECS